MSFPTGNMSPGGTPTGYTFVPNANGDGLGVYAQNGYAGASPPAAGASPPAAGASPPAAGTPPSGAAGANLGIAQQAQAGQTGLSLPFVLATGLIGVAAVVAFPLLMPFFWAYMLALLGLEILLVNVLPTSPVTAAAAAGENWVKNALNAIVPGLGDKIGAYLFDAGMAVVVGGVIFIVMKGRSSGSGSGVTIIEQGPYKVRRNPGRRKRRVKRLN